MESDESRVIKMKNKTSLSKYRPRRKKGVAHRVHLRLAMSLVNNSKKKGMDPIEGPWRPEEDEMLLNLFEKHGPNYWSLIITSIPGRSDQSCWSRWLSLQRSFMPEEDEMLQNLLEKHGPNWSLIRKSIPGRSAKTCRVRWFSSPQVMSFTPEEDNTILHAHACYGDKWVRNSKKLIGRPYDVIRNHWNSTLKWKSSSMITNEAKIPHPFFSDINCGQGNSYIHDWNLSLTVAPSISDMARDNMSSGGTHSCSSDHSAPSLNALSKRDLSQTMSDSDNSPDVSPKKQCFDPVRPSRLNRFSSKKQTKMSRFFEA